MAVYSKLLLSAGGGIISAQQQADQVGNTATVLIGLGGTGIDCLRTIKTQVYSRLKADDPKAVVPRYSHIRFLGVDTDENVISNNKMDTLDKKADENMYLDDSEFFSIANSNIRTALSNAAAINLRHELDWLRWESISPTDLGKAGAGGIRQVGRFMMMDKSTSFLSKVQQVINEAKTGLSDATVNVHIFAGISGGTGAGCFLDVCYMVRSIAQQIGGATIFGYFFLSDVNLSCIPYSDTLTRAYIPKNGYASMQELDYCMQLKNNGGSFTQEYQDHKKIDWKEAPVDMCHLISATNANGDVISNAYEYAMNVTAEYIMDFLTASTGNNFGLASQLANYRQRVNQADQGKQNGFNLNYCVIGAACASIPLREINTYLASELFDRFSSIDSNTPTQADVEALALSALSKGRKNKSEIYDSLLFEIREGADDNYAPYIDDWRFVRDYGNKELIENYTNQTARKRNNIETNAKSMNDKNEKSLIGRIQTQLRDIICDINKGPLFAYRMLAAARGHNLLNIIDGLIEENNERLDQESFQTGFRTKDYENAKSDFEKRNRRSFTDSDKKRFSDYEFYLRCLEQHRLMCNIYEKLDRLLRDLRKQVEDITAGYYTKLNRVTDTLINSFKDNKIALASENIMQNKDGFSGQMMTIEELKPSLDEEIQKINIQGMLDSFMNLLLDNESEWIDEDENKITKLVNDFFVQKAFANFANKTITSFLREKYNNPTDEVLTNKIYKDWMKLLTGKATPLFYYNGNWNEAKTGKLAYLSIPTMSNPIKNAASMMNASDKLWQVKDSGLTDRIYVMCSACALPLCSYNGYEQYELACFASDEAGRHYYEGKTVQGMKFNDWRRLPSLTPQSLIQLESVPYQLKEMVEEAGNLYDEAESKNIFDDQNYICKPDESSIVKINALLEECNKLEISLEQREQIQTAKDIMEALMAAADDIKMIATEYSLPNDGFQGNRMDKVRLRKDYFVSSPVYQSIVKDILKELKGIGEKVEQAKDRLQAKIDNIEFTGANIDDYFDSIFTGVISFEGFVVNYHSDEFGSDDIVLSKRDKSLYPFCTIPLYQAFINYQKLDKETKNEIVKQVENVYNNEYDKLEKLAAKLAASLSNNMLNSWIQEAKGFAEGKDIVDFLKKLNNKLGLYCMQHGVVRQ